jgi:hypothetical protein
MGTWGPAVFSDDLAADVRDEFTDLIGEGLDARAATDRLVQGYREALSDDDDAVVFWIALAATQWKLGRLLDDVRDAAISAIDEGRDQQRWRDESPRLANTRGRHLARLRERLLTSPPAPRKVARHAKCTTSFVAGDIVRYRLNDETSVLFCVVEVSSDRGGEYANIRLLGLDQGRPFNVDEYGADLARRDSLDNWAQRRNYLMFGHEPLDRIQIIERGTPLPEWRPRGGGKTVGRVCLGGIALEWKDFDREAHDAIVRLGW